MDKQLSPEQIENVLKGLAVPSQPQVIVDLQMEQAMPNPDINEIAELISRDVGISGKILKTVNSPFFGLSNKITSIRQAVVLLGIDSVINMVNAISLQNEMFNSENMTDEEFSIMSHFWDTAVDIATVSASIAKQIGFNAPDEAYLLGLLHNAGMPLLMQRFKDYNAELIKESYGNIDERIIDIENKCMDTNHAVLGFYIAKSWKLPPNIYEAIGRHHDAERVFASQGEHQYEMMTLLAILKMAEHIAGFYSVIGKQEQDYEWEKIKENLLSYVGLSEYDFDDLESNCLDAGLVMNK